MFKGLSVGALVLVLSACGAPRQRPGSPPSRQPSVSGAAAPALGRIYKIDENRSELRILVYRAGPLARFGHNHVIINRAIRGSVSLADSTEASVVSLIVPAAGFVVDDAQARMQEGPDFAADVPEDAKSGTLRNMLSAALLDADEFPVITVNSVAVSGGQDSAGGLTASVAISITGHEAKIDVPFKLQSDSQHLSAKGTLDLRQSVLGLTPYSLMLGALQVQDAMTIKFDITAIPG